MKKPIIIMILLVLILSLAACGKEEEDLSWLNKYEHQVATPVPVTATPTPEATPTPYDTMQSCHKDETEVRVQISIGMVYDKPYQGEAVGYLLNEDFTTENLLWADHNNMVGFEIGQMSLYETKDDHLYEMAQSLDPDTIVWIYDFDVLLSLVPHPEDYDMLDWGE